MRKMKILPEFSPVRIELFRVATQRRGLAPDALDDLGPFGRLIGWRRRGLRFFGQGFFDRPGDELVAVGKLTDPLGDIVWKSDGNLHTQPRGRLYLKTEPGG